MLILKLSLFSRPTSRLVFWLARPWLAKGYMVVCRPADRMAGATYQGHDYHAIFSPGHAHNHHRLSTDSDKCAQGPNKYLHLGPHFMGMRNGKGPISSSLNKSHAWILFSFELNVLNYKLIIRGY